MYMRGMVLLCILLAWAQVSVAQTLEGEFKGWRVYTLHRDGQKMCYLSSSAANKTGSARRRSDPYLLVTYRNKQTSEISVSAGYAYRPKSTVTLAIDSKQKHALFTSEKTPEIAWAKDAEEDRNIVGALSRGSKVTVDAEGEKKAASTDTYLLPGFAEAYNRMQDLCQKAPEKVVATPRGQQAGSKESKGKESTGKESTGKESTGKESKGKESTGKESKGKESTGKESKGKESTGKESKGKESKAADTKGTDTKNR